MTFKTYLNQGNRTQTIYCVFKFLFLNSHLLNIAFAVNKLYILTKPQCWEKKKKKLLTILILWQIMEFFEICNLDPECTAHQVTMMSRTNLGIWHYAYNGKFAQWRRHCTAFCCCFNKERIPLPQDVMLQKLLDQKLNGEQSQILWLKHHVIFSILAMQKQADH